jgi:hypothetical protein
MLIYKVGCLLVERNEVLDWLVVKLNDYVAIVHYYYQLLLCHSLVLSELY